MNLKRRAAFWVLAALLSAQVGAQQSYPDRPVRLVVPYAPGGPTDIIARLLSDKLSDLWKQPVVVENRAGASGNVGSAQVARSAPDGYTVLINTSSVAVNASLYANAGYNLEKDLVGVANVANSPNVIVAGASLRARHLREGLEAAKSGKMSYGSPGTGTTPHLSAVMLSQMAGIQMLEVPYKSSAQMTTDAIGGQFELMFHNAPVVLPHIKAGKLKALAVTTGQRSNALPEIAAMSETLKGFEIDTWWGLVAPAATPRDVVDRLNKAFTAALQTPETKSRFAMLMAEPVGNTPDQFGAFMKKELARYESVVKASGAKVD